MEFEHIAVSVCQGSSFDWQASIDYEFDNWEDAQKFIFLSLQNDLIIQVVASK